VFSIQRKSTDDDNIRSFQSHLDEQWTDLRTYTLFRLDGEQTYTFGQKDLHLQ
jgi:hypothetical protein